MKRILTLLLIAVAFTSANAQPREESRRIILGDGNGSIAKNGGYGRDVILGGGNNGSYPAYPANNYPSGNNRQFEIDRVNREYGARIQSVWNDRYLHRGEKKRAVRDLESERQFKIDEINRRCDAWDRDHRNNRHGNDWRNGRH